MGLFQDQYNDDNWLSLYDKFDPLDKSVDEYSSEWDALETGTTDWWGTDGYESTPFLSRASGIHGHLAGNRGAQSEWLFEDRDMVSVWDEDYTDPETGERGGYTSQKEPWSETFRKRNPLNYEGMWLYFKDMYGKGREFSEGADLWVAQKMDDADWIPDWAKLDITKKREDYFAAQEFQEEAAAEYKREIVDPTEQLPDPELARYWGEVAQTAAVELPFLAGSFGTSTAVKKGVTELVKQGAAKATFKGVTSGIHRAAATERLAAKYGAKWGQRAGITSMAGVHGYRSAAGTWVDAIDTYAAEKVGQILEAEPGLTEAEALDKAYLASTGDALFPAVLSGAATALVVSAFGATGIEKLLAGNHQAVATLGAVLKQTFKQSLFEGAEETVDSLMQSLIQRTTYDPDKTLSETIDEAIHAFTLGMMVGGVYSGAASTGSYVKTKRTVRRRAKELGIKKSRERNSTIEKLLPAFKKENPTVSDKEARAEIGKWLDLATEASEKVVEAAETAEDPATKEAEAEVAPEAEAEAAPETEEVAEGPLRLQTRSLVEEAEQRGLPEEEHLAALERLALEKKRVRYIAEELERTQNPDNPKVIVAAEARADQRLREEGSLAEYNKLQSEAEARARQEPQEGTVAWLEKSVIEATDLHSEVVEKFGPDSTQAKDSLDTINYFAKKLAQARGDEPKVETAPEEAVTGRDTEALKALAKARWELLESDEGAEADTTAKRTELLNRFHELAEEQGIPYGRERDEILFKDAPSYISRPWGSTPLGKIEVDEAAKEEPAVKEEAAPTITEEYKEPEPTPDVIPEITPEPETDHVISAPRGKRNEKGGIDQVHAETVDGSPALEEVDLGVEVEGRPAILKYNRKTKQFAVGTLDSKGNFVQKLALRNESLIQKFYEGRGRKRRLVGVRVPKEITSKSYITKSIVDGTETWEITDPDLVKRADRRVREAAPQEEQLQNVIDAITSKSLRDILQNAVKNETLTLEHIRALISISEAKESARGQQRPTTYTGTIENPKELAKLLMRAVSSYASTKEDGATRYSNLVGEPEGDIRKQANSLKSSAKPSTTKAAAVTKLLAAAYEKVNRAQTGLVSFDEMQEALPSADTRTTEVLVEGITEEGEVRGETELREDELPEGVMTDDSLTQDESVSEAEQARTSLEATLEAGAERTQAATSETTVDEDGYTEAEDAQFVLNIAQQIESNRQAAKALEKLNLDPSSMTEEDEAAAVEFARSSGHPDPERLAKHLIGIKDFLSGSVRTGEAVGGSVVPTLPEAKGYDAILGLINRPDNGLTEEAREFSKLFLGKLDPSILAHLTLKITGTIDPNTGEQLVKYEGTFNSLLNIAEIAVSKGISPEVIAHEIAHFTAKLLPEKMKNQGRMAWRSSVRLNLAKAKKAVKRAKTSDEAKELQAIVELWEEIELESSGDMTGLSPEKFFKIYYKVLQRNGIISALGADNMASNVSDNISGSVVFDTPFMSVPLGRGTAGDIKPYTHWSDLCTQCTRKVQDEAKRLGYETTHAIIQAPNPAIPGQVISHWVAIVKIDGVAYIVDEPQQYLLAPAPEAGEVEVTQDALGFDLPVEMVRTEGQARLLKSTYEPKLIPISSKAVSDNYGLGEGENLTTKFDPKSGKWEKLNNLQVLAEAAESLEASISEKDQVSGSVAMPEGSSPSSEGITVFQQAQEANQYKLRVEKALERGESVYSNGKDIVIVHEQLTDEDAAAMTGLYDTALFMKGGNQITVEEASEADKKGAITKTWMEVGGFDPSRVRVKDPKITGRNFKLWFGNSVVTDSPKFLETQHSLDAAGKKQQWYRLSPGKGAPLVQIGAPLGTHISHKDLVAVPVDETTPVLYSYAPLVYYHVTQSKPEPGKKSITNFDPRTTLHSGKRVLPQEEDNLRRVGIFLSPDPQFSMDFVSTPYLAGETPRAAPLAALQGEIPLSQAKLPGQAAMWTEGVEPTTEAFMEAWKLDATVYPVYVRAENPLDMRKPSHSKTVYDAVDTVEKLYYLVRNNFAATGENITGDTLLKDAIKKEKVKPYNQFHKEMLERMDESHIPSEEDYVEMTAGKVASEAEVKDAVARLSNGFAIETVRQLEQINESVQRVREIQSSKKKTLLAEQAQWDQVEDFSRYAQFAGFDGYFSVESGRINIAVFENNQIKSALGNKYGDVTKGFSRQKNSGIDASVKAEESEAAGRILQAVYSHINPDEFYARGMTDRQQRSEFSKGADWAMQFVDALLHALTLGKNKTVKARNEHRKFFRAVEKALKTGKGLNFDGAATPMGMLRHGARMAPSIASLGSAETLQKHLDVLKASGKAKQHDILLGQAAAALTNLDKMIRKYIPDDTSSDAFRIIQQKIADDIGQIAAKSAYEKEYAKQHAQFIADERPELAGALTYTSLQFLKKVQSRHQNIVRKTLELAEDLDTDEVKKMFALAEKAFDSLSVSRELDGDIQAQFKAAILSLAATETDPRAANALVVIAGDPETLVRIQNERVTAEGDRKGEPMIKDRAVRMARYLASSATGNDLLTVNLNQTAADVVVLADQILEKFLLERKLQGKDVPATGGYDYKGWRVAAGLLAVNHSLKENALALAFQADPELGEASMKKFASDLVRGVENKDSVAKEKAISKALKRVTDYTKKAEQKRLIFQKHYKAANALIENLQAHYEASKISRQFLEDGDLKEYLMLLNKNAGAIETPTFDTRRKNKHGKDVPGLRDGVMPDVYTRNELLIPVPDPTGEGSGDLITVNILSSEKGEGHLQRMQEAYHAITEWLDNNPPHPETGDNTSPYYEYYANWKSALENIYLSELVANPRQNTRRLGKNWNWTVLDQLMNNIPARSAEVVKQLIRKHSLYFTQMGNWATTYEDAWMNKMLAAAKSHGFTSSLTDESTQDAIDYWESAVGNELRWSHQEGGGNLEEGSPLINSNKATGAFVTKQDMELLAFEGMITDEAYRMNQEVAGLDKTMAPVYIADKTTATGQKTIMRLPISRGKTFLPRVWSSQGRNLVRVWQNLKVDTNNWELYRGEDGNVEGRVWADVFDMLFDSRPEALFSFMADRNPEFTMNVSALSSEDADGNLVELYQRAIAEVVDGNKGGEAPVMNVQDVVEWISVQTGMAIADVKQHILSEYSQILDVMEKELLPVQTNNPSVAYSSYNMTPKGEDGRAQGPFTKARTNAIAPYYFYQHGFTSQVDLKKFALMGQMRPLENVVEGIKSVRAEMQSLLDEIQKREAELTAPGGKFHNKYHRKSRRVQDYISKELNMKIGEGTFYGPPLMQIHYLIEKLDKFADGFGKAYGLESAGAMEDMIPRIWQRVAGSAVGLTLASGGILIKNALDASIVGGSQIAAAQGQTGVSVYLKGLLWRLPIAAGKMTLAGTASATKIITGADIRWGAAGKKEGARTSRWAKVMKPRVEFGRPDLFYKAIPGIFTAVANARGLDRVIAPLRGFFSPIYEELLYNGPLRIEELAFLDRQGLGMKVTPIETERAFQSELSTGGRGVKDFDNPMAVIQATGRTGQALIGEVESLIALFGRTTFPRLGDLTGNIQTFAAGIDFIHNLERMLRRTYADRVAAGVPLDEDINEEELLGRYLGVMRANKASFNTAHEILSRGGVTNFQKEAKDFLRRLDANYKDESEAKAPSKDITFLDEQQRYQVATGHVTLTNAATPANRPYWSRLTATNNLMITLMGWSTNALQVMWDASAPAIIGGGKRSRITTKTDRAEQAFASIMFMLSMLGGAAAEGYLVVWLMNWFGRLLEDKASRAFPHQKKTPEEQAWSALGLSFNIIPMVGSTAASVVDTQPLRGVMHPGSLVLSKTGTIMRYILETTKTGDPRYGLRKLANGMFPLTGVIDNFSEYGRGKMAFDKTRESIVQFSPDTDVHFYRGETVLAGIQRVSPYKQKMDTLLSAVARANPTDITDESGNTISRWAETDAIWMSLLADVKAREAPPGVRFDIAEKYVGGMTDLQAQRKLSDMLRGRNPLSYARKSRPTYTELKEDLSNMLMVNGGSANNEKDYRELFTVLSNFNDYWMAYNKDNPGGKNISVNGIYGAESFGRLPRIQRVRPLPKTRSSRVPAGPSPKF